MVSPLKHQLFISVTLAILRCLGVKRYPAISPQWRFSVPCVYVWIQSRAATGTGMLTSLQVFAGKDASRALGKTSTKEEDVSPEWKDLSDKEKGVLNDWVKFFSNRYNIVGVVEGAKNLDDETAEAPSS